MRKFEKLSNHEDAILPKRSTEHSAGYDLFAYKDVVIPGQSKMKHEISSVLDGLAQVAAQILDSTENENILALGDEFDRLCKQDHENMIFFNILMARKTTKEVYELLMRETLLEAGINYDETIDELEECLKPVLVKTGIKVKLPEDEFLALYNRSSGPKNNLILTNGVGVVDSDYYNNEDNEGHIMVQFINPGYNDVIIKKGDKIAQGVFSKFYKVDNEEEIKNKRISGHGSTGK